MTPNGVKKNIILKYFEYSNYSTQLLDSAAMGTGQSTGPTCEKGEATYVGTKHGLTNDAEGKNIHPPYLRQRSSLKHVDRACKYM